MSAEGAEPPRVRHRGHQPGGGQPTAERSLHGAWTPNIVWHLSGGARRFGELRVDMPRISAKVLAVLADPHVFTRVNEAVTQKKRVL